MEEQTQEITQKAAKLFHRYGIKSVSMDDVAHELSISKKTLYKLFKDKKDLISKVLDCPAKEAPAKISKIINLNAVEKHIMVYNNIVKFLADLNPSFEYDLKKYYPQLHNTVIKKRRKHVYENMQSDLLQGVKEGFFRANMDIDIITNMNIVRIEGFQTMDVKEVYKRDLLEVVKEFFSYHFHAIATEKGIREFERIMKEKHDE
ncbi:MAG: TetR/AcrR family transcriptional regulator [Bacteroidales bacterium]|nr:TetR/AcrR family transcriptional regulator [Bacteroidales bacterium]